MLRKSIFRTIKKSLGRYLAIFSIIALGVGFFAGLRVTETSMLATADRYLNEKKLYDYRLISTLGLTQGDVDAFRELSGIEGVYGSVSADVIVKQEDGSDAVLHGHTLLEGINGLDILQGRMPEKPNECLMDVLYVTEDVLGTAIRLSENNSEETFDTFAYEEYTVVGLVNASEYINFQRGTTALSSGRVVGYTYLLPEGFSTDCFTEIFLRLPGEFELYSPEYEQATENVRDAVESMLEQRADLRFQGIYDDAMAEINDAIATLDEKKAELADGQKEIDDGWVTLQEKKAELADGQKEIDDGWVKYRKERAEAEAKLKDSKAMLDSSREELDKGWEAIAEAKKGPYASIPQVQAQIAAQEALLQQGEAEYLAGLAAYEKGVEDAAAGFAAAEKELKDAQKQIDEAKPELEKAEKDLADAQKKIEEAKPEIEKAEKEIADAQKEIQELEEPVVYALDRTANFGYASFESDIGIVSGVARVFPVFFFLVAALVCITTMTRMVGEQRTQNGVLKAMGYGNFAVASQYLIYAGSASVLGCVFGFMLGSKFLPDIMWEVYHIMYAIDRPAEFVLDWQLLGLCGVLYLACMLGVTYFVCRKDLSSSAAALMRPEAPNAGKRILLERIGFLWKPLKFLHKVSIRNILRYKKRMFMMIIGIGGSFALLLTGFGVRDTIQPILDHQYGEITLYHATASFLHEPTQEERDEFLREMKDLSSEIALASSGSFDIVLETGTEAVEFVAYEEGMANLVKLHWGGNAVAWPGAGEVVINNGVAEKLKLSVGDTIQLRSHDFQEMSVKVSGIYENYIGDVLYLSADTYASGFGKEAEINTAYFRYAEGVDAHRAGAEILGMENVAAVTIIGDMKDMVDSMLDSLDLIILIVIFCAGALAFIVLYNLTNITITERTREIATLKVLGFRGKEQRSYVFRENIILTVISSVCGIPMGIALLQFAMEQIKVDGFYFGCRLAPMSYVWAFVMTMLFTMIVDLALIPKIKHINMAEAMKAIE
ncbi:MAG: FtsX-like permease family protein [Ruminococcaceae bacterium]|nr:FtsX-like permease family protein [Oscillospiraceae bacterium]